jgi:hypothetical protein
VRASYQSISPVEVRISGARTMATRSARATRRQTSHTAQAMTTALAIATVHPRPVASPTAVPATPGQTGSSRENDFQRIGWPTICRA